MTTPPLKSQRHIGFDIGFQSFAFTTAILSADRTTLAAKDDGAKDLFVATHITDDAPERGLAPGRGYLEAPALEMQRLLQDGVLISPCDAADFILKAIAANLTAEDKTVDRLHVTVPDSLAPNSRLRLLESLRALASRSKTQVNKDEPHQGIDFGSNVAKAITLGPRSQALALWNVAFAGVTKDNRPRVTMATGGKGGDFPMEASLADGRQMLLYSPGCAAGVAAEKQNLDARVDVFRGRVRPGLVPTEAKKKEPKDEKLVPNQEEGTTKDEEHILSKKLQPKDLLPADLIHSESVIHNVLGDGTDAQCRRNAVEKHFGIGDDDIRVIVGRDTPTKSFLACPQFHAEHALVLALMASSPVELMSDTDEDSSDDESDKKDDTASNPLSDDLSSDGEANRSKTTAFFRNQAKQFNSVQTWLTVLLVFLIGVLIQAQLVIVENQPFGDDF